MSDAGPEKRLNSVAGDGAGGGWPTPGGRARGTAMRLAVALVAGMSAAAAQAATEVLADPAAFLARLDPGYFLNTFTFEPPGPEAATFYYYESGPFNYAISGPCANCVWRNGAVISNNYAGWTLQIDFGGAPVHAVGGRFYGGEVIQADFIPATITISLNDGTTVEWSQTTIDDAFRGFVSDTPITQLTMAAGSGRLNVIDDLVVGTVSAVPEPLPVALWIAGLAALGGARRVRGAAVRADQTSPA